MFKPFMPEKFTRYPLFVSSLGKLYRHQKMRDNYIEVSTRNYEGHKFYIAEEGGKKHRFTPQELKQYYATKGE